MKPIAAIATVLLTAVAAAHALRLIYAVELVVGSTVMPMWASVVGAIVPGSLAYLLWKEGRATGP